jgi:hypothetical protein
MGWGVRGGVRGGTRNIGRDFFFGGEFICWP